MVITQKRKLTGDESVIDLTDCESEGRSESGSPKRRKLSGADLYQKHVNLGLTAWLNTGDELKNLKKYALEFYRLNADEYDVVPFLTKNCEVVFDMGGAVNEIGERIDQIIIPFKIQMQNPIATLVDEEEEEEEKEDSDIPSLAELNAVGDIDLNEFGEDDKIGDVLFKGDDDYILSQEC